MKQEKLKTDADEEALIAQAKQGSETAFEALVQKYKRMVEYHIRSFEPSESMYDDLFQEGLIGLLKAVRSYDGKSASFATFASLCVRNNIISGIRKNSLQTGKTVPNEEIENEETSPSAEDVLLNDVGAYLLYEKVFSSLSQYEKTVFELYLSDMSYENIAFVTGKSVKSTTNAIFRIRSKLKKIIGN